MASTTEESEKHTDNDRDVGKIIKLRGVTKTFDNGSIVATNNINLVIEPDDFVVFLGPSGCGKTTTLRCIAGLEKPNEGKIIISGEDVTYKEPKDRDLAYVFQEIALFPHKDVRGNMLFGLDMTTDLPDEEKNRRVDEAAQLLGIDEFLDRAPSELSGGQRQRVSLGRAMVMEPAAFLLDEPFSALDAELRDQMQTEVQSLQKKLNRPMIFVTHDQKEAMTVGDKIVVMRDGNVQQVGSPNKVYNDPSNLFVAQFIGTPSMNKFQGTIERVDGALHLTTDLFSVPLEDDQARAVEDYEGKHVTIGIRPEYIELDGDDSLFDAEIGLVEPKGQFETIFLDTEDGQIRATADQGTTTENQSVSVGFDLTKAWLFNQEGERLR